MIMFRTISVLAALSVGGVSAAAVTCGDGLVCRHGGTCRNVGSTGDYMCDCTTANDGGTQYAGKNCQHEVKEEHMCDDEMFCIMGGSCKKHNNNDLQITHYTCQCPNARSGTHCEYKAGEDPPCTLQCANKGQCAIGMKDYDHIPFAPHSSLLEHLDFQHCICPDGYTGVKCEVKTEKCHQEGEKNEHYCANGSQCVGKGEDSNGSHVYGCDCKQAAESLTTAFAGRFCEHAATEFCTGDKSRHSHSFCTNGGKCKAFVSADEEHQGCDCPDEYEGKHCQLPKGTTTGSNSGTGSDSETSVVGDPMTASTPEPEEESGGNKAGKAVGFSFLAIVLAAGFIVVGRKMYRRSSGRHEIETAESFVGDSGAMAETETTSEDGELSNVEII